jgi:hypothetical protein
MRLPVRRIEGSALGPSKQMQIPTKDAAVIALWKIEFIVPLPVGNPIKLRAVDYELGGRYSRFVGTLPASFFPSSRRYSIPNVVAQRLASAT